MTNDNHDDNKVSCFRPRTHTYIQKCSPSLPLPSQPACTSRERVCRHTCIHTYTCSPVRLASHPVIE
ncbi:hypothetical protein BKA81DRAFT_368335 [Phyllosticta paracitricarpa]